MFIIIVFGNKTAMTSDNFKKQMEFSGYIVEDKTSQISENDYIKKAYIATSKDFSYEIFFYELSDDDKAISFFKDKKDEYEKSKSENSNTTSVSIGNNSKYSLADNDKYVVISRINNTIIFLCVDDIYELSVKELLKSIGY